MTSIERTAYPRFSRAPSVKELREIYTPTPTDVAFVATTACGPAQKFGLMILLNFEFVSSFMIISAIYRIFPGGLSLNRWRFYAFHLLVFDSIADYDCLETTLEVNEGGTLTFFLFRTLS